MELVCGFGLSCLYRPSRKAGCFMFVSPRPDSCRFFSLHPRQRAADIFTSFGTLVKQEDKTCSSLTLTWAVFFWTAGRVVHYMNCHSFPIYGSGQQINYRYLISSLIHQIEAFASMKTTPHSVFLFATLSSVVISIPLPKVNPNGIVSDLPIYSKRSNVSDLILRMLTLYILPRMSNSF